MLVSLSHTHTYTCELCPIHTRIHANYVPYTHVYMHGSNHNASPQSEMTNSIHHVFMIHTLLPLTRKIYPQDFLVNLKERG